ncbi:MAG TPA: DUF779 domain-containing protein [Candidatus Margulisiibacteriota bacterium]|nr:DUF779 domain-containing protein [Candidatus Margulisiibacteriota bacterium]
MVHIAIAPKAAEVVARIRDARTGSLCFTIDGGCCEGTAPHLLADVIITPGAKQIGEVAGVPVYLQPAMVGIYTDAALTIDVVDEPLSDSMSLETEHGLRFVLREGE